MLNFTGYFTLAFLNISSFPQAISNTEDLQQLKYQLQVENMSKGINNNNRIQFSSFIIALTSPIGMCFPSTERAPLSVFASF